MSTPLSMLEGKAAPEWLAGDLAALSELPQAAREELWQVLEPSIAEPMPKSAEALLGEFCARHRVPQATLSRVLRGLRFLYRAAAQTHAPKNKLEDDVRSLLGEGAALALSLVGRFHAPALAVVTGEIHTKTLLAHGKVLTDFEWKVSKVSASTHGRALELPVVTLTLKYQEAGQSKSITLDAIPSTIAKLRDVLGALLR
jgi:hypothetical protein